jgi:hypothetical protein
MPSGVAAAGPGTAGGFDVRVDRHGLGTGIVRVGRRRRCSGWWGTEGRVGQARVVNSVSRRLRRHR